jgi:hypothetical protein
MARRAALIPTYYRSRTRTGWPPKPAGFGISSCLPLGYTLASAINVRAIIISPFMLAVFFSAVSLLYATVGQAGGTAFLALMAFASFPSNEMRPTALSGGPPPWPPEAPSLRRRSSDRRIRPDRRRTESSAPTANRHRPRTLQRRKSATKWPPTKAALFCGSLMPVQNALTVDGGELSGIYSPRIPDPASSTSNRRAFTAIFEVEKKRRTIAKDSSVVAGQCSIDAQ